jgi:hypothetical protein
MRFSVKVPILVPMSEDATGSGASVIGGPSPLIVSASSGEGGGVPESSGRSVMNSQGTQGWTTVT